LRLDPRRIIKRPIITERSTDLRESSNKFVFEVEIKANKKQIKEAVELLFDVSVKKVTTSVLRGKEKTNYTKAGQFIGKQPDSKRAIVTLSSGDKIDIFDQV
jgi:large subunit ribosomal protein L23